VAKRSVTQEEAFLAAIEAAPQDMLPRLVYADWLDERNDPRGEYLRLEVERHRAEARGTSLESSALARLGELEDTLDVGWFWKVVVTDHPRDPGFIVSRFWRALAGYGASHRRMREHLERIPEDQLRLLAEQFQNAICYVDPNLRDEFWPHSRRGWSEDSGERFAAWVVMQGETVYDDVRSQPELIEQFGEQCDAAELDLRRRWDANDRRRSGLLRDVEADRIQFQRSRLDYVAMGIYSDRHGRDLPLFGG
jgi:uncharacterized protein (TIGR02996 family)